MAYSDRDYMTLKRLADYLGYEGESERGRASAAAGFVERTGLKKYWRGKAWVVHPDDVDKALAGESSARLKAS